MGNDFFYPASDGWMVAFSGWLLSLDFVVIPPFLCFLVLIRHRGHVPRGHASFLRFAWFSRGLVPIATPVFGSLFFVAALCPLRQAVLVM